MDLAVVDIIIQVNLAKAFHSLAKIIVVSTEGLLHIKIFEGIGRSLLVKKLSSLYLRANSGKFVKVVGKTSFMKFLDPVCVSGRHLAHAKRPFDTIP